MDALTSFGQAMLNAVLPTMATVIGGLVVGLLKKNLERAKVKLSIEQEQQLRELVESAVLAVEEAGRRRLQDARAAAVAGEGEVGRYVQPLQSDEKHAAAVAMVQERAPWATPEEVDRMIDATLQRVRPTLLPE